LKIIESSLSGAYVIELDKRSDKRGFFARSFCVDEFRALGLETNFVQQNMSESNELHTLRGMHYQVGQSAEVKYIRCHYGAILDVIVDIRIDSPTFMKHEAFELSEHNYKALYVPKGFAHGFLTLTEKVVVSYLVSSRYSNANERAFRWNDDSFDISWPTKLPSLSERDNSHANFDCQTMPLDKDYLDKICDS
jgi:dTDP-4-dehydrorhamnose 3,5-epimerase